MNESLRAFYWHAGEYKHSGRAKYLFGKFKLPDPLFQV
jgi:hypothetical protein